MPLDPAAAAKLVAHAAQLAVGRYLIFNMRDLEAVFGDDPVDGFLTTLPNAARHYKHSVENGELWLERITPDGLRRFVPKGLQHRFSRVGDVFFPLPRSGEVRHAPSAAETQR